MQFDNLKTLKLIIHTNKQISRNIISLSCNNRLEWLVQQLVIENGLTISICHHQKPLRSSFWTVVDSIYSQTWLSPPSKTHTEPRPCSDCLLQPQLRDRRIDHIWPEPQHHMISDLKCWLHNSVLMRKYKEHISVILCVRRAWCLCVFEPLLWDSTPLCEKLKQQTLLRLEGSLLCWFQQCPDAGLSGQCLFFSKYKSQPLTMRYSCLEIMVERCCASLWQNCD